MNKQYSRSTSCQSCDFGWDLLGLVCRTAVKATLWKNGSVLEARVATVHQTRLTWRKSFCLTQLDWPTPPCCLLYNQGASAGDMNLSGSALTKGSVTIKTLKLIFTIQRNPEDVWSYSMNGHVFKWRRTVKKTAANVKRKKIKSTLE